MSDGRSVSWSSEDVVRVLAERGELWEPAPGLVSLRGDVVRLAEALERCLSAIAREGGFTEWRVAPGLRLATLERAKHLESFPQWLSVVTHFDERPEVPDATATGPRPACDVALPSALCYHVYEALADSTIDARRVTLCGACWRREEEATRPLERALSFTMRELVHVGRAEDVREFRSWSIERVRALAHRLGLSSRVEPATDPFYAPTAPGRKLLQQVKGLKTELHLDIGGGRSLAAASFNDHEQFFGECFDIALPDGARASSGCTAFGLERWILAFLVTHGPDPDRWPEVDDPDPDRRPDVDHGEDGSR